MASNKGQRSINYTGSRLERDKTHENSPTKLSSKRETNSNNLVGGEKKRLPYSIRNVSGLTSSLYASFVSKCHLGGHVVKGIPIADCLDTRGTGGKKHVMDFCIASSFTFSHVN
jgi:hypothetical protein